MRLWHKDLIPVLPRQQLLGQWRECCLIAKNITEKGTPGHLLVNRIMDYPIEHFIDYTQRIGFEIEKRGYRCNWGLFEKYLSSTKIFPFYDELFKNWHNTRYLKQCLYNLEEKYDCGGISANECEIIVREYYKLLFGGE